MVSPYDSQTPWNETRTFFTKRGVADLFGGPRPLSLEPQFGPPKNLPHAHTPLSEKSLSFIQRSLIVIWRHPTPCPSGS